MARDYAAVWSARAKEHGARCVVDLHLPDTEVEKLAALQWHNYIKALPKPAVRNILDFGCGPGRFSSRLANTFNTTVTAYDPCPELIEMIPADPRIRTTAERPGEQFDLVFVSLVLGGVANEDLVEEIVWLTHALAPGGTLLLAEHTTFYGAGSGFWTFRDPETYIGLFRGAGVRLSMVGGYMTLGQHVGIFTGKKE